MVEPIITLRRFNNVFSVVIALAAIYILISPLLGNLSYWWTKKTDKKGGYVYQSKLVPATQKITLKDIPQDNRVVIPGIQLDEAINEGTSPYTLNKGLWRRPISSTPVAGGNTVIVGHRFTYKGAAALFNLDKVKQGDRFSVYWEHKEYTYEVKQIRIVEPLDLSVEQNTTKPTLTIYTCTPVWTARQRLVIVSEPLEPLP